MSMQAVGGGANKKQYERALAIAKVVAAGIRLPASCGLCFRGAPPVFPTAVRIGASVALTGVPTGGRWSRRACMSAPDIVVEVERISDKKLGVSLTVDETQVHACKLLSQQHNVGFAGVAGGV